MYRQWLLAMAYLAGYVAFVVAALAQQLAAGWWGADIWWLFALMLAPWAPVLRVVWRTVRATGRVRAMMRARGGRNRLTAILREYLFLGHSALSIRAVGWSLGMVDWPVSPAVPDELLPASTPGMVRELIDQALAGGYGQPLSPRSLQGGLWPDMARLPYLARWDPLAWWWSRDVGTGDPVATAPPRRRRRYNEPVASPFPSSLFGDFSAWQQTLILDARRTATPPFGGPVRQVWHRRAGGRRGLPRVERPPPRGRAGCGLVCGHVGLWAVGPLRGGAPIHAAGGVCGQYRASH